MIYFGKKKTGLSRAGFFTYVEQYLEFLAYAILAGMVTHQDVGQQTAVPYISPRVRHRIRGNPRRKSRMKNEPGCSTGVSS